MVCFLYILNSTGLQLKWMFYPFPESVDSAEYLLALEEIFVGSNLSKLEKLHLEQNEIWAFKNPNIFCNLPSLMDLQVDLVCKLYFKKK